MEVQAQARYEKCLLDEIMKLQDTLVLQQGLLNEQQDEAEQKAINERRARTAAGEKASRLAMLEAAANDALEHLWPRVLAWMGMWHIFRANS